MASNDQTWSGCYETYFMITSPAQLRSQRLSIAQDFLGRVNNTHGPPHKIAPSAPPCSIFRTCLDPGSWHHNDQYPKNEAELE